MRRTREQKNAHRRLMDLNPFHHALSLRTARRWRKAHAEELARKRRERYANDPEYRRREQERQRAWATANPDKKRAAYAKWAASHRDYLREREAKRSASPAEKERRKEMVAERRLRRQTDPEYAAKVREQKRAAYHRNKRTPKGIAWLHRNVWEPYWRKVVAGGVERVRAFLKRAVPRTRHYFAIWYGKHRAEFGMADWRLLPNYELKPESYYSLNPVGDFEHEHGKST